MIVAGVAAVGDGATVVTLSVSLLSQVSQAWHTDGHDTPHANTSRPDAPDTTDDSTRCRLTLEDPGMTTPTLNSAYPADVADLLPRARALALELGDVPARNALMRELRIGAPKANEVRSALADETRDEWEQGAARTRTSRVRTPAPRPRPVSAPPATTNPLPAPPVPAVVEPVEPAPARLEDTTPEPIPAPPAAQPIPVPNPAPKTSRRKPIGTWPLVLLSVPAAVAVWSGWVGLGEMTGFGVVHPLPGIADRFTINSAITLPIGVETYAAYALRVWISGQVPNPARKFAKVSAIGSLVLGALGQITYHVLAAAGVHSAPWWITTAVACFPVAVLGMGAALAHLIHSDE